MCKGNCECVRPGAPLGRAEQWQGNESQTCHWPENGSSVAFVWSLSSVPKVLSLLSCLLPCLGMKGRAGDGSDSLTRTLSCYSFVSVGELGYRKALLGRSFCLLMTEHGCPVFWLVAGWLHWQMLQWFFWHYSVVLTVQTGNSSFSICTC